MQVAGWNAPLDDSLYAPDEETKEFMKILTGIQDDEDLKRHILAVQAKAYGIYKYPYFRTFMFLSPGIAQLPAYPDFLALGNRKGSIFLDMGCCFGNATRKAVLDGWPVQKAVASDLRRSFWNFGHELFRSTPESFPVPLLEGDVLDPSFLSLEPPLPTSNIPIGSHYDLDSAKCLGDLRGRVSAIFTEAFFHLFTYDLQEHIARILAGLLAPDSGSMLFGVQGGRPVKGAWCLVEGARMDCHSPESWQAMWEQVFGDAGVQVEVKAHIKEVITDCDRHIPSCLDPSFYFLEWSVTRI